MGSFDYIDELESDLVAGRLNWEAVLDQIHGSKPWQKADWKKRRSELIAPSCGACDSGAPPMVLQHVWHPDPFSTCCERIKHELITPAYLDAHPLPPEGAPFDPAGVAAQPFELRQACPKCGSVNLKQQKDGVWACMFHRHGRRCGQKFDTPVVTEYRKFTEAHWVSHLESQHAWQAGEPRRAWWDVFMTEYREVILFRAALDTLNQHRRYVELRSEDVVTRCKRCAYREDKAFTISYAHGVRTERGRQAAGQKQTNDPVAPTIPRSDCRFSD